METKKENATKVATEKVSNANVSNKDYSALLKNMKTESHKLGFLCKAAKSVLTEAEINRMINAYAPAFAGNKAFKANMKNTINCAFLPRIVAAYLPNYMDEDGNYINIKFKTIQVVDKEQPEREFDIYNEAIEKAKATPLKITAGEIKDAKGFVISGGKMKTINAATAGVYTLVKKEVDAAGKVSKGVIRLILKKEKYSLDEVIEAIVRFVQSGANFDAYRPVKG